MKAFKMSMPIPIYKSHCYRANNRARKQRVNNSFVSISIIVNFGTWSNC